MCRWGAVTMFRPAQITQGTVFGRYADIAGDAGLDSDFRDAHYNVTCAAAAARMVVALAQKCLQRFNINGARRFSCRGTVAAPVPGLPVHTRAALAAPRGTRLLRRNHMQGLQGTDSFYPYPLDGGFAAFVGTSHQVCV